MNPCGNAASLCVRTALECTCRASRCPSFGVSDSALVEECRNDYAMRPRKEGEHILSNEGLRQLWNSIDVRCAARPSKSSAASHKMGTGARKGGRIGQMPALPQLPCETEKIRGTFPLRTSFRWMGIRVPSPAATGAVEGNATRVKAGNARCKPLPCVCVFQSRPPTWAGRRALC